MHVCEYCWSDLPEGANFCGNCGKIPGSYADGRARTGSFRRVELEPAPGNAIETSARPGSASTSHWAHDQAPGHVDASTMPVEDEEEERRRRAAMPGLLLSPGAQVGGGNAPMVQGTPQIGEVPSVQNTPPLQSGLQAGNMSAGASGWHAGVTDYIPYAPSQAGYMPPSSTHTLHGPKPQSPHAKPKPRGCAPTLLIVAILIPIIILGSVVTLAFTVLAPGLSVSGSSSVISGGTFALHGNHFLPGSSISLTLDHTFPLYVDTYAPGILTARALNARALHNLSAAAAQLFTRTLSGNSLSANGDGTFSATVTVSPSWTIGQHVIQAVEAVTHRSAELIFTIVPNNTTSTPSPTGSVTPTGVVSPSVSPSPTVSPTVTTASTSALSCVNPSSVTLGPVSEKYSQAVSTAVTLCSSGSGSLNWTASWDHTKASWLSLDHSAGTITTPGQAQINVSSNAAQLAAGSYSAIITFSSQPGNATESLTVTFTVQAGCIKSSPATLNFTAAYLVKEAAPQTVSLANCGATGIWSATAKTLDGGNWLTASPTGGTLGGGAPGSITISASTLNSTLAVGKYTGTVTFALGSVLSSVNVNFIIEPGLLVTPSSLVGSSPPCHPPILSGYYVCYVTLTNTSKTASLTWSVTTNLHRAIIKPTGGTLPPGQGTRVLIEIPSTDCATTGASIIFSGPGNSVIVAWKC